MSDIGDKNNEKYDLLDRLSIDELNKTLSYYTQLSSSDDSDMEYIFRILEVIEKREKQNPSGCYTDIDTAWESFQKNYRPANNDGKSLYDIEEDEQKIIDKSGTEEPIVIRANQNKVRLLRYKALLRTACIFISLTVVLFSGTVVAKAFGYDLWGAVAKWTSETFGFSKEDTSVHQPINSISPNENVYSDINEALSDYGIKEALVPTWVPDGFEQDDISISETPKKTQFHVLYHNGDNVLIISINVLTDSNYGTHEKDDGQLVIYEKNNIPHYIMSNNEQMKAVWVFKNYECYISGNISEIELKQMIDSIYE